jgi:hypothetical protein
MSSCEYCPWCCVYISWDSIKGASSFGQHYFQISSKFFFSKMAKSLYPLHRKKCLNKPDWSHFADKHRKNLLFPIFFKIISKTGIVKPGKLLWLNGKASKNK